MPSKPNTEAAPVNTAAKILVVAALALSAIPAAADETNLVGGCAWSDGADCLGHCPDLSFYSACEGALKTQCDTPACAGEAFDPLCEAECTAACVTRCTDDPAGFNCEDRCHTGCDPSCDKLCNASCPVQCRGSNRPSACENECDLSCPGHCETSCDDHCATGCAHTLPGNPCADKCRDACRGGCRAEAAFTCRLKCRAGAYPTCQADQEGHCTTTCDTGGAVACNGEFIDGMDPETAERFAEMRAEAEKEPPCTGAGCVAGDDSATNCATATPGGQPQWRSVLRLLVLSITA